MVRKSANSVWPGRGAESHACLPDSDTFSLVQRGQRGEYSDNSRRQPGRRRYLRSGQLSDSPWDQKSPHTRARSNSEIADVRCAKQELDEGDSDILFGPIPARDKPQWIRGTSVPQQCEFDSDAAITKLFEKFRDRKSVV